MAMSATPAEWTVDMLDALPEDGNRYEIIDGVLFVTPAPSDLHQLVLGALHGRLRTYLRPWDVGRVLMSPADVRREDRSRTRAQPDIFVVRLTEKQRPPYPFDLADLLLAVEVESPGNPAYDYQTKRRLYLAAGVPEYWIVSPESRTISRWRTLADPGEVVTDSLVWQPAGMPHPLRIDLPDFLEDAFG
jgi:Uma2 family endonuclease